MVEFDAGNWQLPRAREQNGRLGKLDMKSMDAVTASHSHNNRIVRLVYCRGKIWAKKRRGAEAERNGQEIEEMICRDTGPMRGDVECRVSQTRQRCYRCWWWPLMRPANSHQPLAEWLIPNADELRSANGPPPQTNRIFENDARENAWRLTKTSKIWVLKMLSNMVKSSMDSFTAAAWWWRFFKNHILSDVKFLMHQVSYFLSSLEGG